MLTDHFGNIDQDKNGGSSIKCSLNLVIFGRLSQTWMILINSDSIWKEFNGSKNSKNTSKSHEVIFTFQFNTKDNKGVKNGRTAPLYGQYWEK